MIVAATARPMTVLEITRDYLRLLEITRECTESTKNLGVPGLLILSSSLTDLAETIPPMCFRVPRGREVSV